LQQRPAGRAVRFNPVHFCRAEDRIFHGNFVRGTATGTPNLHLAPPKVLDTITQGKERRFVAEYLLDFNATQAAVRAGYGAKTAQQQGSRLLLNVVV
jgi:hypothetical protein